MKSCPKKCDAKELKSIEQKLTCSLFCLYWLIRIRGIVLQNGTIFQPKARPPQAQIEAMTKHWSSASWLTGFFFRSWLFWFFCSIFPNWTTPDLIIHVDPLSKWQDPKSTERKKIYEWSLYPYNILHINHFQSIALKTRVFLFSDTKGH